MQTITNNLRLRSELGFVTKLLKVTTTTAAEVWTRRLDPQRRRREYLFDRSKQHIPLLTLNSHPHTIVRRRKRNKHSLPIRMGQSHSARKNPLDLNL
jgi:hypothetical protein